MSIIEKALDRLETPEEPRKPEDRKPDSVGEQSPGEGSEPISVSGPAPAKEPKPIESATLEPMVPRFQETAAVSAGAEKTSGRSSRYFELDLETLSAQGLLTPESTQTALSEQMRRIKRPLLVNAATDQENKLPYGNLLLVTSALPGEGKTFTAINLAMSVAMELDRTVLLIDADVAKSDVSRRLGITAEKGFSDFLADPSLDLSSVLLRTNVPKLTILPCGQRHGNITELFSSEQMKRLAQELSGRYKDRVVIFDSAPVLSTSGATVLASLVGQVVFIVHAEKTLQSAVKEALKVLGRDDHVSLVLNRSREWDGNRYGYGSSYGYYYHYGS